MDLNLLVVFDAIAREGSMVRASSALNMSPSALSHALTRLRSLVGDELFLRSSAGMMPTEHASSLVSPIRTALDLIESSLSPTFDPLASRHTFTIALDNRSALVLASPLIRHVADHAPGVSLDILPSGTLDLIGRLDRGELDAALTCAVVDRDRLSRLALFDDDYVALLRPGHPAAGAEAVAIEALAAYAHLSLSSIAEDDDFVDVALAERGLARHVAVRAPLLSATTVLSGSDMIAVLGRKTANAFARISDLVVRELGFPAPRSVTSLLWHRRWDSAPAHRWLRAAVKSVAEANPA